MTTPDPSPRGGKDARYDAKRPPPVAVRLTDAERAAIAARQAPGESLGQTIKRLALHAAG